MAFTARSAATIRAALLADWRARYVARGADLDVTEDGDAWALARRLADELGVIASPGEFYGEAAADHVRLAVVQPDRLMDLVEQRCRSARNRV